MAVAQSRPHQAATRSWCSARHCPAMARGPSAMALPAALRRLRRRGLIPGILSSSDARCPRLGIVAGLGFILAASRCPTASPEDPEVSGPGTPTSSNLAYRPTQALQVARDGGAQYGHRSCSAPRSPESRP